MNPLCYWLQRCLSWIFLFSTSAHLVLAQNDCDIFYIEQPQVQHSCNPYESGLRLTCTVYGAERLLNHTINWYRVLVTNENISEPELVNEFERVENLFQNRQVIKSDFVKAMIDEGDAGYYWCQVALKSLNSTFNSSYVPSQRYALLPPSVYQGYPPCSRRGSISEQVSMCAKDSVMLPPLFEWPLSTNSTDSPTVGSTISLNPSESSVGTMEGVDPIILIVVTSVLSFFIATLFFILLVVICKLVCNRKRKSETSVNRVEVGGLTPAESETALVIERDTSTRYREHTDVYLPDNSYLSLQQSINTGYVEIENGILQRSVVTTDASSVPAHIISLNSTLAVTSDVPVANISEKLEEPSSPSSNNGCVTMRDGHQYYIIDPNKKEKTEQIYTNRRKPPPLLPKKHTSKHLAAANHSAASKRGPSQIAKSLSSLLTNPMETKEVSPNRHGRTVTEEISLSQGDSRRNDSHSQTTEGIRNFATSFQGSEISHSVTSTQFQEQNTHCNESKSQHYQPLIPNTKDYTSVYSSPEAIPPVSQFHEDMEHHYM